MADMPTDFWSGWIVVLTLVSLAGLGWLVYGVYFGDEDTKSVESRVWDGNLREGSAPAPIWWFWLILATMIFSVLYLMLYPGLGSYAGALAWSQGGRLDDSAALYGVEFDAARAEVAAASAEALQAEADVMASAARVYDRHCSACHGPDAGGQADMFPNLTDDAWQWGGSLPQIEQTLRLGRTAIMPPLASAFADGDVADVVAYVQALSSPQGAAGQPGEASFRMLCAACHGADGTGNELLGAPDLTDDAWLYGSSAEDIAESILNGRMGEMPAFDQRLDDTQIRMLAAWLLR
jgi:cytochrome c oxidase cbb3-type subunit 3